MKWLIALFVARRRRSDTASPDLSASKNLAAISGPVLTTDQTPSSAAARRLASIERRAARMAGNRKPEEVARFMDLHKALCSGGE